ncbi:ABC-2 type transporter-domain-containing protein [Chaetomidium leptoderma]|uniref:ABC-2 type transporter-domain-containing protein n=1 Tax=Chaetomidium leptoderma TaxID=669021 RepID=A0AAN6VJJ5_9PEZI|nr:ABC-2 type transporter-domain-containing protein [Chaetomidium leptoderma]
MARNTLDGRDNAVAEWLDTKRHHDRWRFGVAFSRLDCHAFTSSESSRYQPTVTSWALAIPQFVINQVLRRPRQKVQILQNFNGLLKPGEMLLVLGRPGSGCSTFLKTLAGDTQGFQVADFTISYSGIPPRKMHRQFKGDCIYLAELDLHFPELTLGETLEFSARARETTVGKDSEKVARAVASLFHLDSAFDTKVGNAMIRGLSGGEKKRASIAEAFLSGAQLQCWDNSTRGLDSSTALRFIQLLRQCTDALQSAVAMSIYQASEDMYRSFDKVTLLYEGRQIYFGPVDAAAEYFTRLGFVRPNRATTADFLTSLTHPAERIVREDFGQRAPRTPDEFAAAWEQSDERRALELDMDAFYPSKSEVCCGYRTLLVLTYEKRTDKPRLRTTTYSASVYRQICMCLTRSVIRMRNNLAPIISGSVGQMVLAIVIGSVFYNLEPTTASFDKRAILLYFGLMLNAFSPAFEIYNIRFQRPVIEKHARYALHHPSADALASWLADLPTKVLTSALTNIPLYFMTNLRRDTADSDGFFVFWLFMLVCTLTMSVFFRMLGSLSRTLEETMAPVSTLVMLFVVYAGYVIPPGYMVPWLGWVRWVNPVYFAYEALMVNEFDGREFPCTGIVPVGPDYPQSGMEGRVCSAIGAVAGEQTVQGAAYLAVKFGYVREHLWRNLGILFAIMFIFGAIHLLATELIPARRSRGEILLFKRQNRAKEKLRRDEEIGTLTNFSQDTSLTGSVNGDSGQTPAKDTKGKAMVETTQIQSSVFHWSGLGYEIKTKDSTRPILNNIDGWVKPGTLTALMGVTGAGKTTLLDVLADRVTAGEVSGDVFIDGKLRDESFGRRIGYVQQEDIHMPTTTVREALEFSALLRQPNSRSDREKLAYVDHVLDLLEMTPYADAIVGVPGEGLNVEQRKRLTIGVEMVARPELLLFLDEPTSGLDSQTAWSICKLLRRLADNGQAVLCTIHQPSSQLFEMFDRLLLLEKGGNELYFGDIGPDASTLINYFESNGAPPCPPGANPAEWMIESTRASSMETGEETKSVVGVNWPEIWSQSPQKQEVRRQLVELKETLSQKPDTTNYVHQKGEYAASLPRQLVIVLDRTFRNYWRDPLYLDSRFGLCICVSLANGLSFYNSPLTIQGLTNLIFSIFLATQLFSNVNQQVIPRFTDHRALFEARERRDRSYSWTVFVASSVLVEVVWQTLVSGLVFVVWYYPTGMWRHGGGGGGEGGVFGTTAERGALMFCLVWMFCLWITTLSHALGAGMEHPETSVNLAVLLYWLSLVFCGVLVAPSDLPGFWVFLYRAVPLTYLMNGMAVAGLVDTRISCSAVEMLRVDLPRGLLDVGTTCGAYLESYVRVAGGYVENPGARAGCQYCPVSETNVILKTFGMRLDGPWRNVGFMVVYVVFNVVAAFALYWLGRVPKRNRG